MRRAFEWWRKAAAAGDGGARSTVRIEYAVERTFDRLTQNPDVLAGGATIRGSESQSTTSSTSWQMG